MSEQSLPPPWGCLHPGDSITFKPEIKITWFFSHFYMDTHNGQAKALIGQSLWHGKYFNLIAGFSIFDVLVARLLGLAYRCICGFSLIMLMPALMRLDRLSVTNTNIFHIVSYRLQRILYYFVRVPEPWYQPRGARRCKYCSVNKLRYTSGSGATGQHS